MLRPTLSETLKGLERTIMETLLPELSSPYAQSQAMSAILVLDHVARSLDPARAYDAAEIEDLRATLSAIGAAASSQPAQLRDTIARARSAASPNPPDRGALEAAIAELAAALAVGRLSPPADALVRGYLKRNLERMGTFLISPFR